MLSQDQITLRAVEPADLDFLYEIENQEDNWLVSQTVTPFSKQTLNEYVTSLHDITVQKQLRLIIVHDGVQCGAVDLFEYDPVNVRAGIGVLVIQDYRGKGIASIALGLVENYAFNVLHLNQIWCNVLSNNEGSQRLFEGRGYVRCGVKKHWTKSVDGWLDEIMYQLERK